MGYSSPKQHLAGDRLVAVQTSNVVQRLGGERRSEGTGQRHQQEAAKVHAGTVGRMRAKVNQPLTPAIDSVSPRT